MTTLPGVQSAPVLIAGVSGADVPTLAVRNPARTSEVVGEVALAPASLAARAVEVAHEAYGSWSALPAEERARYLLAAADALEADLERRTRLLTREQGKVLGESKADVGGAPTVLRYYAGLAEHLAAERVITDARGTIVVRRCPMGPTAVIVPWNAPVYLCMLSVAPALMAGNTVVVKPSELAPLAVSETLAMMADVLPPGVVGVVPGYGPEAGAALARHPLVRKVMFTGSTATGRQLMRDAADTMKNLSMELGGNDPALVLEGARVTDELVRQLRSAVFTGTGQICFNVKRIYVHRSHYGEFVERYTDAVAELVVGDGLDPRSDVGPLNNARQFEKVAGLIDSAERSGAAVATLGTKLDPAGWDAGYFVLPRVVTGIDPHAELVEVEQFGPIVPILAFDEEDEAVAMANDSEYGLAASVWSDDVDHAFALARRIEAGTVFVNVHRAGASDVSMPFGGFKQSGIGRNHAEHALDSCCEVQTLAHRVDMIPIAPAR